MGIGFEGLRDEMQEWEEDTERYDRRKDAKRWEIDRQHPQINNLDLVQDGDEPEIMVERGRRKSKRQRGGAKIAAAVISNSGRGSPIPHMMRKWELYR